MAKKKVYKCDVRECEKLFSSKFSLKRHNLKHINSKKHICSHCQKAFSLPQYLEEHEYTHTGARPFVCGINNCAETFRQRGKLSIHRKNAHQSRGNDDNGPSPLLQTGGPNSVLTNRFMQRLEQLEEEEKYQYDQQQINLPLGSNRMVPGVVNGNLENQQLHTLPNQQNFSNSVPSQQQRPQPIQIQNRQSSQVGNMSSLQQSQSPHLQQLQHQQQQIPSTSKNQLIKQQSSFNPGPSQRQDRDSLIDPHLHQNLQHQWSEIKQDKIESVLPIQQQQQQLYFDDQVYEVTTNQALTQYMTQKDIIQSQNQISSQLQSALLDVNGQLLSHQPQLTQPSINRSSNQTQQQIQSNNGNDCTTGTTATNFSQPKLIDIQYLPKFGQHNSQQEMQRNMYGGCASPSIQQQVNQQNQQPHSPQNKIPATQYSTQIQQQQQQQFNIQTPTTVKPQQLGSQQNFGLGQGSITTFESVCQQQMLDSTHTQLQTQQLIQQQQQQQITNNIGLQPASQNISSCSSVHPQSQFLQYQQN